MSSNILQKSLSATIGLSLAVLIIDLIQDSHLSTNQELIFYRDYFKINFSNPGPTGYLMYGNIVLGQILLLVYYVKSSSGSLGKGLLFIINVGLLYCFSNTIARQMGVIDVEDVKKIR
jgi:hypothetical protein